MITADPRFLNFYYGLETSGSPGTFQAADFGTTEACCLMNRVMTRCCPTMIVIKRLLILICDKLVLEANTIHNTMHSINSGVIIKFNEYNPPPKPNKNPNQSHIKDDTHIYTHKKNSDKMKNKFWM